MTPLTGTDYYQAQTKKLVQGHRQMLAVGLAWPPRFLKESELVES